MNRKTAERLNRLNLDFYRRHAEEFSRTRERAWPGWERVAAAVEARGATGPDGVLSVLDVGCGNGRFCRFLERSLAGEHDYLGLDSSSRLLEITADRLAPRDHRERGLLRIDLIEENDDVGALLAGRRFGLIAIFGLLHHLPGLERRARLLADLARLLEPDGLLALSFWQFGELDRFRARIAPWRELDDRAAEPIDEAQLEPGDHLLAWGDTPGVFRYCHHATDAEVDSLLADLDLEPLEAYHADGAGDRLNRYAVLRRPS